MKFILVIILGALCCIFSELVYLCKIRSYLVFAIIFVLMGMLISYNIDIDVAPEDVGAYISNFNNIDIGSRFSNVQNSYYGFENGFMLLSMIIKIIIPNCRMYIPIVFLIQYVLIYIVGMSILKNECDYLEHRHIVLFVSLWMGYFGLLYGMVALRAGLAIHIALMGYFLKLDKKYLKAISAALIAFSIHRSIVLFVTGIIICEILKVKSKKQFIIWWLICFMLWTSRIGLYIGKITQLIAAFLGNYIPVFRKYSIFYVSIMGNGFLSKKNIFMLIMGLLYVLAKPEKDKNYIRYLKLYFWGLTLAYITCELTIGYRISDMFLIFGLPLSFKLINYNFKITYRSYCAIILMLIFVPFIISIRMVGMC